MVGRRRHQADLRPRSLHRRDEYRPDARSCRPDGSYRDRRCAAARSARGQGPARSAAARGNNRAVSRGARQVARQDQAWRRARGLYPGRRRGRRERGGKSRGRCARQTWRARHRDFDPRASRRFRSALRNCARGHGDAGAHQPARNPSYRRVHARTRRAFRAALSRKSQRSRSDGQVHARVRQS